MDQRLLQLQYRVEHQHSDGSWSEMTEERANHHDAAANDPERVWSLRRIFRCPSCGETTAVTPGDELPSPDAG